MWLYIYTGREGWAKKTANAMKETLNEMNRLKSNCSANSHIYTLFLGHCFLPYGLLTM